MKHFGKKQGNLNVMWLLYGIRKALLILLGMKIVICKRWPLFWEMHVELYEDEMSQWSIKNTDK